MMGATEMLEPTAALVGTEMLEPTAVLSATESLEPTAVLVGTEMLEAHGSPGCAGQHRAATEDDGRAASGADAPTEFLTPAALRPARQAARRNGLRAAPAPAAATPPWRNRRLLVSLGVLVALVVLAVVVFTPRAAEPAPAATLPGRRWVPRHPSEAAPGKRDAMMPRARLTVALAAVVPRRDSTDRVREHARLQQSTAAQLQAGVQNVTAAAAAGDFEAAQASLEAVQADLLTAAAAEEVSAARAADIQSALNLVSGDLVTAIEASKPEPIVEPAPSPSPTPTSR